MTAIFTLTKIKSKKCSTLFRCLTNCAATNNGGIGKSVSLLLYNESNQQMHNERNWCCHVAREVCIYSKDKFTAVGFDLWKLNKKNTICCTIVRFISQFPELFHLKRCYVDVTGESYFSYQSRDAVNAFTDFVDTSTIYIYTKPYIAFAYDDSVK